MILFVNTFFKKIEEISSFGSTSQERSFWFTYIGQESVNSKKVYKIRWGSLKISLKYYENGLAFFHLRCYNEKTSFARMNINNKEKSNE